MTGQLGLRPRPRTPPTGAKPGDPVPEGPDRLGEELPGLLERPRSEAHGDGDAEQPAEGDPGDP
jgi:hypothetical protein